MIAAGLYLGQRQYHVALAGRKLEGEGGATSKLNMHREAYRLRPGVRMVIHAHPPAATAFAATSAPILPAADTQPQGRLQRNRRTRCPVRPSTRKNAA